MGCAPPTNAGSNAAGGYIILAHAWCPRNMRTGMSEHDSGHINELRLLAHNSVAAVYISSASTCCVALMVHQVADTLLSGFAAYSFLASSRAVKNTQPPSPIHMTLGCQPCTHTQISFAWNCMECTQMLMGARASGVADPPGLSTQSNLCRLLLLSVPAVQSP